MFDDLYSLSQTKLFLLLIVLAVVVIIVGSAMITTFAVVIKLHRAYKMGHRMVQECGVEYMEGETGMATLYNLLQTRNTGTAKQLHAAMTLLRFAFMLVFVLLVVGAFLLNLNQKVPKLLIMGIVAAIPLIMYIVTWPAQWDKFEKNIYNDPNNPKKEKAYMGTNITFHILMILTTLVSGVVILFKGVNKDVGTLLTYGSIALMALFLIITFFSVKFVALIKTVHYAYYETLIGTTTMTGKLNQYLSDLITTYMPEYPIASDDADYVVKNKVRDMLMKHYAQNIRDMDNVVLPTDTAAKDIREKYNNEGNIWKYTIHRSGKEFDVIKSYVSTVLRRKLNPSQPNDFPNNLILLINNIRNTMRQLRTDTNVARKMKSFFRTMAIVGFITLFSFLYILFNAQYKLKPGPTLLKWIGTVLALVVVATCYGWVNTAIRI